MFHRHGGFNICDVESSICWSRQSTEVIGSMDVNRVLLLLIRNPYSVLNLPMPHLTRVSLQICFLLAFGLAALDKDSL